MPMASRITSPLLASSFTSTSPSTSTLNHTNYRIGRGETGVLTFEPYKSALLPLWRFRTPPVARQSAQSLYARFLEYDTQADFVGMDMCRKFIQMGMTRARRYANYRGGRKYGGVDGGKVEGGGGAGGKDGGAGRGKRTGGGVTEDPAVTEGGTERARRRVRLLEKSDDHKGKKEKEEASLVFKEYWVKCREHEGYIRRKQEFQKEQREWDRERKRRRNTEG